MKIIIDARMIIDRLHGIARVLLETLKVFREKEIPHEISLLTNNKKYLKDLDLIPYFNAITVKSTPFSPGEFLEIPSVLRKTKADLYHAASISVPLQEVMPTVVTILDLIPLHSGKIFHKIYCKTVLRNAARYSRKIIAISQFTKRDIVENLGCDPEKIVVTYLAAAAGPDKKKSWDEIKEKFGIEKPFLFCLANPKPHKNLKGLIDIYDLIREKRQGKVLLVIGSKSSDELNEKINNSSYNNDIIRIDYIDELELDALYANTDVFVYTSYFEGFGLPPLEAMMRGAAVVSSPRTSLSEIVGDGGMQVDPDEKEKFADSVIKFLDNENIRREYGKRALEQASKFSWERCALETLKVYESAI
ncbi:MAG: glycosyltransferase family 4 protein [Candidatus Eremiobacteraeota bacterium]|nr:glycosyltransferase family 4 protein [Candidatus Eremiobacteraeota bacterium]